MQVQCGAKCFLVEIELAGEIKTESVIARTPITARKTVRNEYGKTVKIISVMNKKSIRSEQNE